MKYRKYFKDIPQQLQGFPGILSATHRSMWKNTLFQSPSRSIISYYIQLKPKYIKYKLSTEKWVISLRLCPSDHKWISWKQQNLFIMQRSLVIYRSQGHWKTLACQFIKAFLTLGSLKVQCTHDMSLVQPLGYFGLQKRASHQKHCPSTVRRDFFNHANQIKIAIFLHILNKNILLWILVSFYTNQTKIHLLANVSICVVYI